MPDRWLSQRALTLPLSVVLGVPGCLLAGWWQVTRGLGGNGLSYLYSVEWPVFALVGVWMWCSLLHADPENVGAPAQWRIQASRARAGVTPRIPQRRPDNEGADLAVYNDRHAELAADLRPKTWRTARVGGLGAPT